MSADEQLDGLELPEAKARATEAAVRASVAAAQLEDRDRGAGELAIQQARAVDLGMTRRDPYAVAAAGRELSAQLQRLRLDPVSRLGNDAGDVATWLEALANPSGPTTPAPAPGVDRGS